MTTQTRAVQESVVVRWARRAVTVPVYLTLGVTSVVLLPVTLAAAILVDLLRRSRRCVTTRCTLALTLYFACEAIGIALASGLWLAGSVLPGCDASCRMRWNVALQRWWARTLLGGACRIFAMRLELSGIETTRRGPVFIFSRHASTLDTLLPAALVTDPDRLHVAYVMKRELLWDPCLDIVGQRTRNAFVRRGSEQRDREIALLEDLARTAGPKDAVLLFPEGTRCTPEKRARAIARLDEAGDAARAEFASGLESLLPPRRGGALALMASRPDVDIVFLAHAGFEATSDLNDIWNGALIGRTIQLHFRRVPSAAIPREPEARATWLDRQWANVDAWVSARQAGRTAACRGAERTIGRSSAEEVPR